MASKGTRRSSWRLFLKRERVNLIQKKKLEKRKILNRFEIANLPDDERKSYERYLDNLRYQASIAETLKFEAEEKVRKKEKLEIGRKMKLKGLSNDDIFELTGLSKEEIDEL